MNEFYVVANCIFHDLIEAWNFKEMMGFPDHVCSTNMFWENVEIVK
jgi:hypothetical protein